ncbi:MAG: hypothetical protein JST12_02580 [Armatimonadetes bacterium]|nr:hypothetical protein [Armatimonadota bacterium]MBS1728996.1 hypothetical protein [Armatimonadota bacterium]
MSDGGYSRIEKDFLGNERMVHYDGSGNMIGASDVVREPDGTIRIPNDPVDAIPTAAAAPTPATDPTAHIPNDAGKDMAKTPKTMPTSQAVTYFIAVFVVTMLLGLGIMSAIKARGGNSGGTTSAVTHDMPTVNSTTPPTYADPYPHRNDDLPQDPKPRNDEQPDYDPAMPDRGPQNDGRPRINPEDGPKPSDDTNSVEPSDAKPAKTNETPPAKNGDGSDPIDLRGDNDPKPDPSAKPIDIH